MKVKIFDESHELDLETAINKFLKTKEVEVIDIKLKEYVCFRLGEGLQKKEEDFAAEVAAQLAK